MSTEYPIELMDMLAYHYHPCPGQLASAYRPYILSEAKTCELDQLFANKESEEAFDFMQKNFISMGYKLSYPYYSSNTPQFSKKATFKISYSVSTLILATTSTAFASLPP